METIRGSSGPAFGFLSQWQLVFEIQIEVEDGDPVTCTFRSMSRRKNIEKVRY